MNRLKAGCSATFFAVAVLTTVSGAFADANTPENQGTVQNRSSGQSGPGYQGDKAADREQGAAGRKGDSAAGSGHPVVYMLVPVQVASRGEAMKGGCWARFHDQQNFGGDSLTLVGPVDMANMTGPFGINWKDKISSVETGAKARVLVYDNENFKDLVATVKPGQKVPDVSKKLGFFDEFSSLKISCDGT